MINLIQEDLSNLTPSSKEEASHHFNYLNYSIKQLRKVVNPWLGKAFVKRKINKIGKEEYF